MKSVVVFCSASDAISPIYFSEMEILANALVQRNFRIVYGGAKVGLMGCLANAVLKSGGQVVGVIPKYLAKDQIVHSALTELIVVDDLLDRKKKNVVDGRRGYCSTRWHGHNRRDHRSDCA